MTILYCKMSCLTYPHMHKVLFVASHATIWPHLLFVPILVNSVYLCRIARIGIVRFYLSHLHNWSRLGSHILCEDLQEHPTMGVTYHQKDDKCDWANKMNKSSSHLFYYSSCKAGTDWWDGSWFDKIGAGLTSPVLSDAVSSWSSQSAWRS